MRELTDAEYTNPGLPATIPNEAASLEVRESEFLLMLAVESTAQ
jgi:hypothetical protein